MEEEIKKAPGIQHEHFHVDDAARRLIRFPRGFDVLVTSNMFGDILADEAGEMIGNSSCGPCFGAHMGLLGADENCIAAINRNFKGRMGSQKARVTPGKVKVARIRGRGTFMQKLLSGLPCHSLDFPAL